MKIVAELINPEIAQHSINNVTIVAKEGILRHQRCAKGIMWHGEVVIHIIGVREIRAEVSHEGQIVGRIEM